MIVDFHPTAEDELIDTALYYESKLVGLGSRFQSEVERGTALLKEYPLLGPEIENGIRLLVLRRFPYSLIYSLPGETLYILAVAHHRKKPGYWRIRSDA